MPPLRLSPSLAFAATLLLLILYARPTHAFGAGNIASVSKIEGQNWRHGDVEDTLLTLLMSRSSGKKFSKMDVKRVYFGNWLRDYSQALDVGALKMVSAEAIRILLWIVGFMSFGFGTREFEVTRERLGVYRPEEHIDNPKDYNDNMDARQYDERLRGPIDEQRELGIDPRTGLKNYIATEDLGIDTSANLVRHLFTRSIQLGRRYNRNGNQADLYEALRLLGTACHCLEDYSAHSNYTELALIEMGERDVFPHVGRNTQVQVDGVRHPVYPCVTGTFGFCDFLYSLTGELGDKAAQSEMDQLEGCMVNAQGQGNNSYLKDILDKLPSDLFGGEDESGKADQVEANATAAQMQNQHISPQQPAEWEQSLMDISQQIYPIMEFHDELMMKVTEAIESIPILPELLEQFQEQLNMYIFSLLAPFVLPIIGQVKNELSTGSSELLQSNREKQFIVFSDDYCSDPTHSMLSKDHFTNFLNEPAGQVASQVLKWVVPQIVDAWDDDGIDPNRTCSRIINGVFHHPAQRQYGEDGASECRQLMFQVVEKWWSNLGRHQDYMRNALSRDGVENGRNQKEGMTDHGHGSGRPLAMPTLATAKSSGAIAGLPLDAILGGGGSGKKGRHGDAVSSFASEAVGGGAFGGIVGGIVGGAASDFLGGGGDDEKKKKHKKKKSYEQEDFESSGHYGSSHSGGYQQRTDEYGSQSYSTGGSSYQQSGGYSSQSYSSGGGYQQRGEYGQQSYSGSSGYTGSGGYDTSYGGGSTQYESRNFGGGYGQQGGYGGEYRGEHEKPKKKKGKKHGSGSEDDGSGSGGSDDGYKKKKKKGHKKKHHSGSEGSGGSGSESGGSHKKKGHKKHGSGGGGRYGYDY